MWKDILKNTISGVIEWAIFTFSIVIPIYISFFPSNIAKLDTKNLILVIIILSTMLLYLAKLLYATIIILTENNSCLPKLKVIQNDLYIFEKSELFDANSYVTLYCIDESQERIAIGYVDSIISTSKRIQVKLISQVSDDIKNKIKNNKNKIFIKPTITLNEVDENTIQTGDTNE